MENIKQLMVFSQQISALMDDLEEEGCKILNVQFGRRGIIEVHLEEKSFFKNFHGFKIEVASHGLYKFHVSKIMQGVEFFAITDDLRHLQMTKFTLRKGHKKSLRALQCG